MAEPPPIDWLCSDRWSALGSDPVLVVDAARHAAPVVPLQALIIGVDREGALPAIDAGLFDLLLTTSPAAPAPWVSVDAARFDAHLAVLAASASTNPVAATMLAQVLRMAEVLPFGAALQAESLAYSTLLGGGEFARWRAARQQGGSERVVGKVRATRTGDAIELSLDTPANRNAMTASMRDALFEALANIADDPSAPSVHITAQGACFSTGGALEEFGSASDLAEAHAIRTVRSCAALIDRLGPRASVHFHGACIGSGLEIFATAAHRSADPSAFFQLPELSMGLIPGAGGAVTVSRAIGRHRTAWMVLSGKRVRAAQAMDWGLIHGIENLS